VKGRGPETDFFWELAEEFLTRDGVEQGTIMGFPCLRLRGEFLATCWHATGDLIVKLPRERVTALIEAGQGEPFAPAGRVFKEWVQVAERDEETWRGLLEEGMAFVGA
jgi:hypothetical protein